MKRLVLLLIIALFSIPSWAANGYLQSLGHDGNAATTTTCAVTLAGTTSGSLLVYTGQSFDFTITMGTPSDGTNTWTLVRGPDDSQAGGHVRSYSWYAVNATSGSLTVTSTRSSTNFGNCFLAEFSGLGASPTPHVGIFADQGNGGVTAWDTGAATISAGDLIIVYGGNEAALKTCTSGTGYTLPASTAGTISANGAFSCLEYNLSGAGGSTNGLMTISSGSFGGLSEISFTPTGGGGGPPRGQFPRIE